MLRKIGTLVCLLILAVLISSCGEHKEANADIASLENHHSMPAAFGGSKTLEEAADEIYAQQISLCEAYFETYQMTDVSIYSEKYPEAAADKLMESLTNKRRELNEGIAEEFIENIGIILEDVTDCEDKERYTKKIFDDARLFFNDYNKIKTATAEDFVKVNNVLVNYAKAGNDFALRVLADNKEFVMAMAIRDIEYNATAEESFRANITKNNDTIDAINIVYGGLGDNEEYRDVVDKASMTLLVKLLESVETMTEEERQSVIAQLEEMQAEEEQEAE